MGTLAYAPATDPRAGEGTATAQSNVEMSAFFNRGCAAAVQLDGGGPPPSSNDHSFVGAGASQNLMNFNTNNFQENMMNFQGNTFVPGPPAVDAATHNIGGIMGGQQQHMATTSLEGSSYLDGGGFQQPFPQFRRENSAPPLPPVLPNAPVEMVRRGS